MTRAISVLVLLLLTPHLVIAISGMAVIHESDSFVVFAEDSRDYSSLISSLEADNVEFQTLFGRRLHQAVRVYIYEDQRSFNMSLFGTETPFIDTLGAAYWGANRMHLVSPFGTDRDPRLRSHRSPP